MKINYIFFLLCMLPLAGCKKYLDAKPNQALALPKDNLQNLQLLLDDTRTMNTNEPSAGEIGTDNFFLADPQFLALKQLSGTSANLYVWSRDVFNDNDLNDWTVTYKVIFNANLVLDAISQITPAAENLNSWNSIKGSALFFRANAFLYLLQEFAGTYNSATSQKDLGIALRTNPDITDRSTRTNNEACYQQVLADLKQAASLLPNKQLYKTRPNQAAALGLISRAYLLMGDYPDALKYAKRYIDISPDLLDYNTLSSTSAYPIARFNSEVNFHATAFALTSYSTAYGRAADSLYAMYATNDLRRTIYYKNSGVGNISYKGSYDGTKVPFGGVATDEIFIIAAECAARTGAITDAMKYLNTLLLKRWKKNTYVEVTASDQASALQIILTERRKELAFRNLRWGDLKRLNQDPLYAKTLSRNVNGTVFNLAPNDKKYVLPIPDKVIQASGMQQN